MNRALPALSLTVTLGAALSAAQQQSRETAPESSSSAAIFGGARASRMAFAHDGPMGDDEINLIKPGRNYGWPVISYGLDDSGRPVGSGDRQREGMEEPFLFWNPSRHPTGCEASRRLAHRHHQFTAGGMDDIQDTWSYR